MSSVVFVASTRSQLIDPIIKELKKYRPEKTFQYWKPLDFKKKQVLELSPIFDADFIVCIVLKASYKDRVDLANVSLQTVGYTLGIAYMLKKPVYLFGTTSTVLAPFANKAYATRNKNIILDLVKLIIKNNEDTGEFL
jgi:hypothetical protein